MAITAYAQDMQGQRGDRVHGRSTVPLVTGDRRNCLDSVRILRANCLIGSDHSGKGHISENDWGG